MLKPQDVLLSLKLVLVKPRSEWSYKSIASSVGLSIGETYNALARLKAAGLAYEKDKALVLVRQRLCELLVFGLPAVYYQERGPVVRGMLTAKFAPSLAGQLGSSKGDIPLVWPHPSGKDRGETLLPLYASVPAAAEQDEQLYELLVLCDVMRVGRPKERELAKELLVKHVVGESSGGTPAPAGGLVPEFSALV